MLLLALQQELYLWNRSEISNWLRFSGLAKPVRLMTIPIFPWCLKNFLWCLSQIPNSTSPQNDLCTRKFSPHDKKLRQVVPVMSATPVTNIMYVRNLKFHIWSSGNKRNLTSSWPGLLPFIYYLLLFCLSFCCHLF